MDQGPINRSSQPVATAVRRAGEWPRIGGTATVTLALAALKLLG